MRTLILFAVPSLFLACGSVSSKDPDGGGGGGGGGEDAQSQNTAPSVESIDAPDTIPFGDTVALTCNASDDDGDTLTYTWTTSRGAIVGNGSEVALDASEAADGGADITCKVEDGQGGEDEMTVQSQVQVAFDDLIARYEFAGDTTDVTGNGNDGTPDGVPQFVADRFGTDGAAIHLDGSVYVDLANEQNFDLTTYTITAWINTGSDEFSRFLVSKPGGGFHGNYGLELLGSGSNSPGDLNLIAQVAAGNFNAILSDGGLPQDQWVHIAVTMAPEVLAGYLDGEPGLTFANPPAPLLNDQPVTIGCDGHNEQFYDGDIDDLRFYSRPLTVDEIAAIAGNR